MTDKHVDIKIDFYNLHIEWHNQPQLYMDYGEKHAKAIKRLKQAEKSLKIIKSQLAIKIRKDPDAYELDKYTDAAIKDCVRIQPEYDTANDEWIQALYEEQQADADKWSFQQRKEAIEGLVRLYALGYFSVPNLPRDIDSQLLKIHKEELKKDTEEELEKSAEGMKSRLKRLNVNS
uniref:Uncharacterized protein n=1 Tax=viral metagenome TaxID=1070528 RepID=A0A6M3KX75_9ZZZZ